MNLRRLNLVLIGLLLALGVALAVLSAWGDDTLPGKAADEGRSAEYVDITRAATAQVTAFLNIDYQDVDAQTQAVLDGATGEFKEQYAAELDNLKKSAAQQQSTADAEVIEVGISDVSATDATVFVAANTQVTSKATKGEARTVPWRIQLTMTQEDGRWLTSGLKFVE